jgi:hypothetical protein
MTSHRHQTEFKGYEWYEPYRDVYGEFWYRSIRCGQHGEILEYKAASAHCQNYPNSYIHNFCLQEFDEVIMAPGMEFDKYGLQNINPIEEDWMATSWR